MENDDCFIQVPDENSLEGRVAQEGGGRKQRKTERKEAKSMVHSVELQGDPPGQ